LSDKQLTRLSFD